LMERSKLCTLTQAFCKEVLEGRGPIYCDMRHFSPEDFARLHRVIPHAMRIFDRANIDLSKRMVEYSAFNGVFCTSGDGGMRVNTHCETSVPGLYGAGAATKILPHGTYAVGGLNLAYCCVSGYRAGESAARYAVVTERRPRDADQARVLQHEAFAPTGREVGVTPDQVFDWVREVTVPAEHSTFKHEKRIKKVLARLEEIKSSLDEISAPNPHDLVKANEARNYAQCAELVFRAALERKESRGQHYREEYPYRDDANWLKWLVLRRQDSAVGVRMEHVPIWRYPIKPQNFDKKPHPVQFFVGE
ncbi:MAG: FAD-binding protein, partial [Chloroflexi bacterium]|nr:FAD-binding protein [Chloroflexota bacterium]